MTTTLPRHAVTALAVVALAAASVLALRPLEPTMPIYAELAEQLRAGPVTESFEPLGYPWLIARIPAHSVAASAKGLHLACYALLVLLACALARRAAGPVSPAMFIAVAWILFNPYVLVNLFRLNDNSVTVVAVLAVFALIGGRPDPIPARHLLLAGALVGALALVRPNVVSLVPAVLFAAWHRGPRGRAIRDGAVSVAAVLAAYAAFAAIITGNPAFRPGNGPYNLFAGNNPAAWRAIVTDYNAEPSLPDGLAWCGVDEAPRLVGAAPYVACTRRFVAEHPGQALPLAALKLYNLMWRPNLRLAESALDAAVQAVMIVPAVLWWAATGVVLVRRGRLFDPIATVFVCAFALPFVLTNSDPRFRLPLDPVFVLSLASPASVRAMREAV